MVQIALFPYGKNCEVDILMTKIQKTPCIGLLEFTLQYLP